MPEPFRRVRGTCQRPALRGPLGLFGAAVLAILAACSRPGGAGGTTLTFKGPGSGGSPGVALVVASLTGPGAPASTVHATATCPVGTLLLGGGSNTDLASGAPAPPSLHTNGSEPVDSQGLPLAGSGATATAWSAIGATGGLAVLGGRTTAFALCGQPRVSATVSIQPVANRVAGPTDARSAARATATCPARTTLVGGGGETGVRPPGNPSPSLHLTGSFPSSAAGVAASAAGSPADSWTAVAGAGGRSGSSVETRAVALCARGGPGASQVITAVTSGPFDPGRAALATARCPAGTDLLSGGVNTGPAKGGTAQQGLHLTGSFPSSASGSLISASGTAANAWTVGAEAGGQGAPEDTRTTAFALCTASGG